MSSPAVESEVLLVSCEDDTIITITQTVGIPVDAQNPSSNVEVITTRTS